MGELDKFNLEKFVATYVSSFFSLLEKRKVLRDEDLYDELAAIVAASLKISKDIVKNLERPFYWVFFCDDRDNSPFELFTEGLPEKDDMYARFRIGYQSTSQNITRFSQKVLENYGMYFEARIKGTKS